MPVLSLPQSEMQRHRTRRAVYQLQARRSRMHCVREQEEKVSTFPYPASDGPSPMSFTPTSVFVSTCRHARLASSLGLGAWSLELPWQPLAMAPLTLATTRTKNNYPSLVHPNWGLAT